MKQVDGDEGKAADEPPRWRVTLRRLVAEVLAEKAAQVPEESEKNKKAGLLPETMNEETDHPTTGESASPDTDKTSEAYETLDPYKWPMTIRMVCHLQGPPCATPWLMPNPQGLLGVPST